VFLAFANAAANFLGDWLVGLARHAVINSNFLKGAIMGEANKCGTYEERKAQATKKPSAWARTPTLYKARQGLRLWFLFVYMPSLGLK
jgi:hypothetical protein